MEHGIKEAKIFIGADILAFQYWLDHIEVSLAR